MKNPKNYFEGFFSGASRISRVWGRHSPTRFPQGQNERKANFGTAVESCSKKSTLRLGVLFAQFLLLCPTTDNLQFCQTERQTFFNAAHFRRNGRKKKQQTFFRFTACMCRCNGRRLFSCIGRGYSAKAKLK